VFARDSDRTLGQELLATPPMCLNHSTIPLVVDYLVGEDVVEHDMSRLVKLPTELRHMWCIALRITVVQDTPDRDEIVNLFAHQSVIMEIAHAPTFALVQMVMKENVVMNQFVHLSVIMVENVLHLTNVTVHCISQETIVRMLSAILPVQTVAIVLLLMSVHALVDGVDHSVLKPCVCHLVRMVEDV